MDQTCSTSKSSTCTISKTFEKSKLSSLPQCQLYTVSNLKQKAIMPVWQVFKMNKCPSAYPYSLKASMPSIRSRSKRRRPILITRSKSWMEPMTQKLCLECPSSTRKNNLIPNNILQFYQNSKSASITNKNN